jgi:hypothetical protein
MQERAYNKNHQAQSFKVSDLVLALPKELSRIHNVFYVSLLELWQSRDGSEDLPMLVTLEDDSIPEYEVETILKHRKRKGQKEYFVK